MVSRSGRRILLQPFAVYVDELDCDNHPNLILLLAGHRHKNTVTPQPSPDPGQPERGFWEVETASLRDFPQEFRTFDIRHNCGNAISIVAIDVDPAIEPGSPAAPSRAHAVGTARVFTNIVLNDGTSPACNAELVKPLTPAMQARIANYGGPRGHRMTIERDGSAVRLTLAGTLQSANALPGPWNEMTGAPDPYTGLASEGAKFFRAFEQ